MIGAWKLVRWESFKNWKIKFTIQQFSSFSPREQVRKSSTSRNLTICEVSREVFDISRSNYVQVLTSFTAWQFPDAQTSSSGYR